MNAMSEVPGLSTYDIRTSPALDQLAAALLAAERAFPSIPKNKAVQVKTDKGNYAFKYADLDSIHDATKPHLFEHGIIVIQMPCHSGGRTMLATRLLHTSGQWIEGVVEVKAERPGAQGMGSAITYFRRYALSAALNIVADPDDDGNAADGNRAAPAPRRQPQPRQTAPAQRQPDAVDRDEIPRFDDTAPQAGAINSAGMSWPVISRDGTAKPCANRGAFVAEWKFRLGKVRDGQKSEPVEKRRTLAEMGRVNADTFNDLRQRGEGATADEVTRMMAELDGLLDKQAAAMEPQQ